MRYDHFSMLPERAFQPRGRYGMTLEGGDSGGGRPQPTSTSQTTIPEYAQPYMERLLGKAEAASEAPYQTYGGERLSQTTPEQEAARGEVARLTSPGQFATGTGLATLGGLSGLGYGGQAAGLGQQYMGMATSPQAQQAFMSPYMQNVVDVQRQEAIRSAQMGQLGQNLAAARQGTYGGARQALAQTERERNLGQQLAQIQATGSQRAFEAAQQAQQFGSQLGLQGLQAGIGAAGQAAQTGATLGQLGIGQQQTDLARLQAQEQFGALGQRERQAALDLAYQDFLAQQRYPYSQLGFMSDILRGSGNLAGTGGTALYQAPPSTGSQLLGLASTLGGAYMAGGGKFFREGGEVGGLGAVKNFAGGGAVKSMFDVNKLTAEQIEDTREDKSRPDIPDLMLLAELDSKIAEFKRLEAAKAQPPQLPVVDKIRQEAMQVAGLPSIPVDENYYMPEEQALASGGIVAFADGGMAAMMPQGVGMPSMEPGMPYGVGYTSGMGYEGGGIVAFQNQGLVSDPMFGAPSFVEEDVTVTEVAPRGLSEIKDARERSEREKLTSTMTLSELQEYNRSGKVPDRLKAPQQATTEPAKTPAKPAAPKVEVSDKSVKKVQQAEDKYEKYLTKLMEDAGMEEADKSRAIGFALMKLGSSVYGARKGQEAEKLAEGMDRAADTYVGMLNKASKDKKEAMKTLAEYGLAKERLGIQREQVAATREGTAESAALRREAQQEALQQKYFADWSKRFANVPEFRKDGTPNPAYKSFQQYMKDAQLQTARGPETSVTAPGERPPITSFRG